MRYVRSGYDDCFADGWINRRENEDFGGAWCVSDFPMNKFAGVIMHSSCPTNIRNHPKNGNMHTYDIELA